MRNRFRLVGLVLFITLFFCGACKEGVDDGKETTIDDLCNQLTVTKGGSFSLSLSNCGATSTDIRNKVEDWAGHRITFDVVITCTSSGKTFSGSAIFYYNSDNTQVTTYSFTLDKQTCNGTAT